MNKVRKKAVINKSECVACGSCVSVCPLGAIQTYRGVYAVIDENKCVGCGKCQLACPACVIRIEVKE